MTKLTIIHPAVGKVPGQKYLRAWQMEPLPVAMLAALIPKDFEVSFFDDRMEEIPYDQPTDLVLMSVETCTAHRAYQIASVYRKNNVPVIMGGFHPTLCPEEVAEYAETVIVGEAENILVKVLDDFKLNQLERSYTAPVCEFTNEIIPDRSIYAGKNYLKITLLESGRGCRFHCEFCSIHNFFRGKHHFRPIESIIKEIAQLKKRKQLFFFVDDNIVSDQDYASELFCALIPLRIKWVGQADITIAKNPKLLKLMSQSGCQGVLIGFENLRTENLKKMGKNLFPDIAEVEKAIKSFHKHGLRIYGTFLFGYDHDEPEDFDRVLKFSVRNKLFMIGFNHLTPFPGTQLYKRLESENKLRFPKWWLSDDYTYGQIPFESKIPFDTIEKECRRIRYKFYGFRSMLYRMSNFANINSWLMLPLYLTINTMLRRDTGQRKKFPLGDRGYQGELVKVKH